jgi:hypothetical protein
MAKAAKTDKGLSKRASAIERKVDALTREAPERPEDAVARQAMPGQRADHRGAVEAELARLQGRSRSDLMSDVARGASSPLNQVMRKGKRR